MLQKMDEVYGMDNGQYNIREVVRGEKKRQVGLHPAIVKAHVLDPRFKSLGAFSEEVSNAIWDELKRR